MPSMMVGRVSTELFQHRYYRLNKIFMMLLGQWPYQSTRVKRGIITVFILFYIIILVAHILGLVKNEETTLLDYVLAFSLNTVCAVKLITLMWNSQKTLMLFNRIYTNWQVWARDKEVNILHKYAEQGRKMSIVYAVALVLNNIFFMTLPTIPKIIDVLLKNGTEPGKFPVDVDYYYLDAQKYYFYIIIHFYFCGFIFMMIIITTDIMLIVYVQHVCGIFAALGHKLERIGKIVITVESRKATLALNTSDTNFQDLVSCIDRHNDAIEYAELIEAIYTWSFFTNIGIGVIVANVTGIQILMRARDFKDCIRFMVLALSEVEHFYVASYISQILIDHSISIRYYIHDSQWYRLSLKAQKLLQLMMLRCNRPCQLTAGKMLIMCLRNFGSTVKTTLSYFALLRSLQGL